MKYLTETELRRFFAQVNDPQHAALFALIYRHGLRVSEAVSLKVSDLCFDTKPPTINITRVKKKKNQVQVNAIDEDTAKLLKRWIKKRKKHKAVTKGNDYLFLSNKSRNADDHLSKVHVQHIYRTYAEDAGIVENRKRYPHALRHSCAIQLARSGLSAFDIQLWLGHLSVTSTQVYVELAGKEKTERESQIHDALCLTK